MPKLPKILKKRNKKIMVVSEDFAKEVEDLSKKLNTSSLDVISAGLELLKNSLNKEIVIRQPDTGKEKIISAFRDLQNG